MSTLSRTTFRGMTFLSAAFFAWHTMVVEVAAQPVATAAPEYTVNVIDAATPAAPKIEMPDISGFTKGSIESEIPGALTGKATIVSTDGEKCLSECFGGKLRKNFEAMQGTDKTRIIKIQSGALTLAEVIRQVGDESIATTVDSQSILRLPLLVGPSSTLVIRGDETPNVRLATKQGAFLANQGTLVVTNATISSWDESTKQPTPCNDAGKAYRPFVTSFAGSRTYLGGSQFRDLGYLAPSAYGLSITSHPNRNKPETDGHWPTGKIIDCEFHGLFYGFYSFEARDVAIVGNQYVDNIRYGIDPHDRSTRLIIAKNSATGTKEKHGIIGSREVSHCFVFDNVVSGNAGTGIMLDRKCSQNVIANNRIFDNGTGIAVYESADNQIINNLVAFNKGNGLRVRNSRLLVQDNEIVGNTEYAVMCESKKLDDHEKRIARGDTYEPRLELSVFSNALVANVDGLFKGRNLQSLRVSNIKSDVDLASVNARIGGEKRELDVEDDDPLEGDLESYFREFDAVTDSAEHILEISIK